MTYNFPTQNPDAKSPYPAPAPAPTPRPSEQTSTTTAPLEPQQQQAPVPSLSAIDTLLFTIPSLREETSSETTSKKRSFGKRGEESQDNTKKPKPENQDDDADLDAKRLAADIEFSLELELFRGMETQGTDLMLPSDAIKSEVAPENDVAMVQAPQAHVREPTVLELLQTIQGASTWDAPHIIDEIIPSLPLKSVIQIFGQLQGIHSWKRAWILCSLSEPQRREWNRLLHNGQTKIYGLHALQQVSLTDELVEGLKKHPMWQMNACMDPEQIVAMCSITIDSHWMLSYLAACLIENKQYALQILDFLSSTSSQVLNHLEPVHFLELLNAQADTDLPFFLQGMETDYPQYVEYLFAMNNSSEKIIQMGKLLQFPASIVNAKKGIQNSLLLSDAEKKQVIFKIACIPIPNYPPREAFLPDPNRDQAVASMKNLITSGSLWIEKGQVADFLTSIDPDFNYLSLALDAAPDEITHFFATLSDLSTLEKLGSIFCDKRPSMICIAGKEPIGVDQNQTNSVSMAIQGLLSNPACQSKQKEILLSIFTKRAERLRDYYYVLSFGSEAFLTLLERTLLWLDPNIFAKEERISLVASQINKTLPETATSLGVEIKPTNHFDISSQAELEAFLERKSFRHVRSLIIRDPVKITTKGQLEVLIAVLKRCATLTEVNFHSCRITAPFKEITLEVPQQTTKGDEGQLLAFQQLFYLLKQWIINKKDRTVNIAWQDKSIFSGPTPLCFKRLERFIPYKNTDAPDGKVVLKSFCGLPKLSQLSELPIDEVFIDGGQLDRSCVQEISFINPLVTAFTWENAQDPQKTHIADVQEFLFELCKKAQGLEKIHLNKILPKNSSFSPDFLEKLNALLVKRKNPLTLIIDGKPLDQRIATDDLYLEGLTTEEAIKQLDCIDPKHLKRLTFCCQGNSTPASEKNLYGKLCQIVKHAPQLEILDLEVIYEDWIQLYHVLNAAPNLKCLKLKASVRGYPPLALPGASLNLEEIFLKGVSNGFLKCVANCCPRLKIVEIQQQDLWFKDVMPFLGLSQIEVLHLNYLLDLNLSPIDKRCLSHQLQDQNTLIKISPTLHTLLISNASDDAITHHAPLFKKRQKTLFLGNRRETRLLFRKRENLMPNALWDLYLNRQEAPEIYMDRKQGQTIRAHREIINARAPGLLQALQEQTPSMEAVAFVVEYLYIGGLPGSIAKTAYNSGVNPPIPLYNDPKITLTHQQYVEVCALLPDLRPHILSSYQCYLPDYSLYFKSFENMKNDAASAPPAEVLRFELGSRESHYVHRVMLQAFCPKFAKEVIKEPSFEWKYSPEALSVFIEFLYSANLNPEKMNANIAYELIKFSHVYPVQYLNDRCSPYLKGTIDQQRLLDTYKDAVESKNFAVIGNCLEKILQEFDAYLPLIEQQKEGFRITLLTGLRLQAVSAMKELQQEMPAVELEMDLAHYPKMVRPLSPPKLSDSPGHHAELYEVLKDSVASERLSDVILEVNGKDFPAHKLVLIQSPYFKNLFLLPMKEKDEKKIKLDYNIPPEAFQLLLEYFYTGKITPSSPTLTISLLKALEIFFPGRTNQPLENGKDPNHFLAQRLKHAFDHDCLNDQPAIFTLYEVLQQNPLAYLEREVHDYFSTRWHKLDLRSENFKKMAKEHRDMIYKIVSAGLSAVSELTKFKTIENQKSV